MTHTSTELKQMLALADARAEDWEAVRLHLVVQALRDLVARVQELEASQAQRVPLNKTHEYAEHKKYPGACRYCGYAEHEPLQHGITQEKQG